MEEMPIDVITKAIIIPIIKRSFLSQINVPIKPNIPIVNKTNKAFAFCNSAVYCKSKVFFFNSNLFIL